MNDQARYRLLDEMSRAEQAKPARRVKASLALAGNLASGFLALLILAGGFLLLLALV